MKNLKNIIAICGSNRAKSLHLTYIQAVTDLAKDKFNLTLSLGLDEIPHFNPDLDIENPPEKVLKFRKQLKEADGILICTPEYAMGVPGTLKNALDWTVSSCEFSHKAVALITASSLGEKGHHALLETLHIIESDITEETQLLISYAKTKINHQAQITDNETLSKITNLINAFDVLMENKTVLS